MIVVDELESQAGAWRVATRGEVVVALGGADGFDALLARRGLREEARGRTAAGDALRSYFAGDVRALDALPVDGGGTPFQRAVWQAVRAIPCGETRTYGEIARGVGRPSASRAVGAANGRNPIALIVPCHRVVSPGGLRGYAWGLPRKEWLLSFERARTPARMSPAGTRPAQSL